MTGPGPSIEGALRERVKELQCLYGISALAEQESLPLPGLLQAIVLLMPPAWQFPEVAEARIELDGAHFQTPGYQPSPWTLWRSLRLGGSPCGRIEVCYREPRPTADDGPFLAEEGKLLEVIAERVATHVARRRAEERQQSGERRLRAVFGAMSEGVALVAADGTVTLCNEAARRLLGRPAGDVLGQPLASLEAALRREDGAPFLPGDLPSARAVRERRPISDALAQVHRPDGSVGWLRLGAAPLTNENGGPAELVLTFGDWGGRRRVEEALRSANALLARADERKTEFLGVLSHELRNPLAPIRNGLFVLSRSAPGGEEARRALAVVGRQVNHLVRLVDDLLDVTRINRGKVRLDSRPVELAGVVRQTVEDYRDSLSGRKVAVDLPSAPVPVHGDPVRLAQVVGNLLANAAKFTPPGGDISVAVRLAPATAVLEVADTGVGIEPGALERIFEPFVQAADPPGGSRGGLGLGLALVRGLSELHGGTATAHSQGPGRGARFIVTLPRQQAELAAAPAAPRPSAGGGGRLALIIEDNRDAATTLAEALELLGHRAELASGGEDGLEKARALRPDAVICDLGLPAGMDGHAVARALRAEPATAGIHLIALTGHARPDDQARALDAGFEVHLSKPPDLELLDRLLRSPRR